MAVVNLQIAVDAKTGKAELLSVSGALDKVGSSADKAKPKLSGLQTIVQGVGQGMGQYLAQQAVKGAQAVLGFSDHILQAVDHLSNLSAATGIGVEALQKFEFAGKQVGLTADDIATGMKKLQVGIAGGSKETSAALNAIGLSGQQLAKMLPEEQLITVVESLNKVESPALKAAAAVALLGKAGTALLPLGAGLRDAMEEAERLGLVMDSKTVKATDNLGDRIDVLKEAFGGLLNNLGAVITTNATVHKAIELVIQGVAALSRWVHDNREAIGQWVTTGILFATTALAQLIRVIGTVIGVGGSLLKWFYEAAAGAVDFAVKINEVALSVAEAADALPGIDMGDTIATLKGHIADLTQTAGALRGAGAVVGDTAESWAQGAFQMADSVDKVTVSLANGMDPLHGYGEATKQTGDQFGSLSKEAEALAKKASQLGLELQKALLESTKGGMTELGQAFTDVDVKVMELNGKLDQLVKEGLSTQQAEAFRAVIGEIGANLRDAAIEAERAKVIGETFADVNKEARNFLQTMQAWQSMGGSLSQLTDEALGKLEQNLAAAVRNGAPLDAELRAVRDRMAEIGLLTTAQEEAWNRNYEGTKRFWDEIDARVEALKPNIQDLYDLMSGLGALARSFGMEGVANSLGASVSLMQQFDKAVEDGVLGWGEMAGLAASAVTAFKQATDSASAMSRALGGGMVGASIGSKVGGLFGPIGAAIGGAAGGIIGAVAGIFHKPEWVKVGKEAGKVLGVSVSKELAEEISKTAKSLHISIESASLLHITDAMDESGKSAVEFSGQMQDLLAGIASGSIPAKEGIESLGSGFSSLADEAEAGSVAAMASMGQLAAQARQLGVQVPEIADAVRAAVQDSAGALQGLGGIQLVDEADAAAQAQIFLNVFNGVLATDGVVAAAKAIQPALKTFEDQLAKAGIGKNAAASILGPVRSAMSLLKNDMTKGGAEGAQALKTILESQLKAGFLDVGTFQAIQQQAGSAFDQMIKGGANTKAALQAVAPLLAQIQQTAVATGQAIDPVTQGLVDQAKAAGIAFPTDTGQQMVTLLGQVVELLGGIPATFQAVGAAGASALGSQIPNAAATGLGQTQQSFDQLGAQAQQSFAVAAGAATSSLGTISSAAMATSSTVVSAFDGVGSQITTAITPATGAIESQLQAAFQAGILGAQNLATLLGKLDNTTLTIPFKFEGTGDFPGGGGGGGVPYDIPKMAGGGTVEPRPGGTLALIGEGGQREHVLTDSQLKAVQGSRGPTTVSVSISPTIHVQGGGDPRAAARELIAALDNNVDGAVTKLKRVLEGQR